jgi:hypothetical protein
MFTNSFQEEAMSKNRHAIIFVVIILLIFSLACSISATPKKEAAPSTGNNAVVQPQTQPQTQPQVQPPSVIVPTTAPLPVTPVGLNKGLASLNSYTYSMQVIVNGPTAQDKNTTLFKNSYTSNGDNSSIHTESVTSTADDPKGSNSSTTIYQVGNKSCTVSGDPETKPEKSDLTPAKKEISNIVMHLTDTIINPENPVLVGTETVSGVNCNHYTFKVSGLGKTSGSEVTQSSGEYWAAVDGNYLVKYDVVLETRNAPGSSTDAEVLHSEVHFLLSDINAPITIQLPAECS